MCPGDLKLIESALYGSIEEYLRYLMKAESYYMQGNGCACPLNFFTIHLLNGPREVLKSVPRDLKRNLQLVSRYIKVKLKYFTCEIPAVMLGQKGQMDVECLTGTLRFCEIFRKASRRWMSPYAPLWWRGRQDESK